MERELLRRAADARRCCIGPSGWASPTPDRDAGGPAARAGPRRCGTTWGIRPVYKMVDTCAAEFAAATPYFYSTYETENEAPPLRREAALVIGSGPIRIGQGIEFDYCSVRGGRGARRRPARRSIMINSNPETVTTDFDASTGSTSSRWTRRASATSWRTRPRARTTDAAERAARRSSSSAGRRRSTWPSRCTRPAAGSSGSSVEAIDLAEDREQFEDFLHRLEHPAAARRGVSAPSRRR